MSPFLHEYFMVISFVVILLLVAAGLLLSSIITGTRIPTDIKLRMLEVPATPDLMRKVTAVIVQLPHSSKFKHWPIPYEEAAKIEGAGYRVLMHLIRKGYVSTPKPGTRLKYDREFNAARNDTKQPL